jgi:hypothetical protein
MIILSAPPQSFGMCWVGECWCHWIRVLALTHRDTHIGTSKYKSQFLGTHTCLKWEHLHGKRCGLTFWLSEHVAGRDKKAAILPINYLPTFIQQQLGLICRFFCCRDGNLNHILNITELPWGLANVVWDNMKNTTVPHPPPKHCYLNCTMPTPVSRKSPTYPHQSTGSSWPYSSFKVEIRGDGRQRRRKETTVCLSILSLWVDL